MEWGRDLALGVQLARGAGARILESRKKGFTQERKADQSLVTSADLAADAFLRERIHRKFPQDAILTEESGWSGSTESARVWVIDPLDGTRAFANDEPGYSVMVSLVVEGIPRVGAVHFPDTGETVFGETDRGAWVCGPDGKIQVLLQGTPPQRARGRLTLSPASAPERRALLLETSGMVEGRVVHGAGHKMCLVARGGAEAYFSGHGLAVWDTAAAHVLVLERGGTVSLQDGSPLSYGWNPEQNWSHGSPVLVTRGVSHERVLHALRDVG
jgi:3'(2'),5'-bisphosphate nucleotidase